MLRVHVSLIRISDIPTRMAKHRAMIEKWESQIRRAEWDLVDDIMSDLEAPIEDEMIRILDEQEEEIIRKSEELPEDATDPTLGGLLLTMAQIFDVAYWLSATVNRLGAYARNTMAIAYKFGLAQIGREDEPGIRDEYVRTVMRELERWNYKITEHTRDEVQKIIDIALYDQRSMTEFRSDIRGLFSTWKVYRPRAVSVFNVTYPFNDGLFRSYLNYNIPWKQWISQRDGGVRPTHVKADGQIQRMSDFFEVGRATLMYPGDLTRIATNPEELHGCRCAIKPILDPAGAPD